jgi:uncharacterized protein YeaO (DUF488 family)
MDKETSPSACEFGGNEVISIKRAYESPASSDGVRYLVDRLWPRGITKDALAIQEWLKDASPSNELRKRFHDNPTQWKEFRRRYFAELEQSPAAWEPILEAARAGNVTLVYAARDPLQNNAIALKEFLDARLL